MARRAQRDHAAAGLPTARQLQRASLRERGLPVPERLRAAGPPRRPGRTRSRSRAARALLDPRWRPDHRHRQPARRHADGHHQPHHRRVDQLPARRARLPRAAVAERRGVRSCLGRLRPARPGGGPALDAREHRRVRWRPARRDDRRRVRRRLLGVLAAHLAAGARSVRPRGDGERQLHEHAAGERRADRHAVRRGVRLHRSGHRCHLHAREDRRRAARQPGLPGRAVADLGRDGAPGGPSQGGGRRAGSPASRC